LNTLLFVISEIRNTSIYFCVIILFISSSQFISAQNFKIKEIGTPYINTYTKEDHGGHESTYMGLEGDDGLMYFGNILGVLQFDGMEWRLYGGLDDNYRDLIYGPDERIYIITKSNFGYFKANESGELVYHSLDIKIPNEFTGIGNITSMDLIEGNRIVLKASRNLLVYDISQDQIEIIAHAYPIESSFIRNGLFNFIDSQRNLIQLKDRVLEKIVSGKDFGNTLPQFIIEYSDGKLLFNSNGNQLYFHDLNGISKWKTALGDFLEGSEIRGLLKIGSYVAIATQKSGVFILDEKGNLIQRLRHDEDLGGYDVISVSLDKQRNLWVIQNGVLSHVLLSSPYSKLEAKHGIDSYILDMKRVKDKIYLATDNGIIYKDDDDPWQGIGDYKPFKNILELSVRAQILVEKDNKLFAGVTDGLVMVDGIKTTRLYTGEGLMGHGVAMVEENRVIFGSTKGHLHVFEKDRGTWNYKWQVKGFQHPVDFIEEVGDGDFWVTDSGLGVIKIRFNSSYDSITQIKSYGVEEGLPNLQRNRLYRHQKGLVFLTEKGLYVYDPATDRFIPDKTYENLLRENFVVRFIELKNGNIMSYSWKDGKSMYHFLRKTENGFRLEETPHQLIADFSAENITAFEGDEAWIGSSGLRHYDPSIGYALEKISRTYIRKVMIVNKGDSLLHAGNGIGSIPVLNPNENAIKFDFSSTLISQPDKVEFQSYLKGSEKTWSNWTTEKTKNYTNLPHGSYTFRVRSRDIYGQVTEIGEYSFVISTPWYLTTWVILIYIALSILILYSIIKWNARRLIRKNEELEETIQKRTAEISQQAAEIGQQKEKAEHDKELIQEQRDRLQELDKVKSRFFANISHELRTPLTLINAPLELLIENGKINDEETLETLRIANRNGQSLLSLIEEILDLAKLDAGKLALVENPVRMKESLELLLRSYKSAFKEKSISFEFVYHPNELLAIMIDEKKCNKVINNMLSNALKFTPLGGEIKLEVTETEDSSFLQIKVSDTGVGIHPNDLPHVFDRYYQSEQPGQKAEGGTGIGLALTKELSALMGGSITVTSELEKGTAFKFILPKNEVEAQTIVPMSITEGEDLDKALRLTIARYSKKFNTDKPVLLITEDHPEMRAFVAQTLQPYFEIKQAENGAIALDILNKEKIDIVISDVMMPVMDGFELLEEIKKNEALRQVSLIMLTARTDAEDKLYALTLGIDDYLTKPFSASEFLARIKNILENRIKIIRELKGFGKSGQPNGDDDFSIDRFIKKYDFSEREVEVMRLMAQRKNNVQIAEALFVSVNTVKFHIKNIYGKLGIKSRLEAVHRVRHLA